jgi:hypothetical protein
LPPCKTLLCKYSAGWKYSVFKVRGCPYDAVLIVRQPYTSGISALETPFIYAKKQEDIFSVLHKHQYIFCGCTSLILGSSGFKPIMR